MPLMNINFVIASKNPKELSEFYAKINSDKVNKGFNATHYFISLSNRSKIHFYRPNKNHEWQRKGNRVNRSRRLLPGRVGGRAPQRPYRAKGRSAKRRLGSQMSFWQAVHPECR